MSFKKFVLACHFAVLVHGDMLLDYTQKSFERLPNWIQENVDDSFPMDNPVYFTTKGGFMAYELKEWNVTATGMKGIRLLEKPKIFGSLFFGDITINLKATVDLLLSGNYNTSDGILFPYVDNVDFTSSGIWSANTTVITSQKYYLLLNASINGSLSLHSAYQSKYTPQASISNLYFDGFLDDKVKEWYYPIMKEGFGKDLEERASLSFQYNRIDVFEDFFDDMFKNVTYFDITGKAT